MKHFKKFISFEGIDFSGKTTQIQMLIDRLRQVGIRPEVLREPGGTAISEKIREILLSTEHPEMHERTEILLYEAARAQLVHQKLIPMLNAGKYIIADRYYDSTTCYQGYGRGLNLRVVHTLNRFATSGLRPYRTFFLDISPQEAYRRQTQNRHHRDRLESGGVEFFQKIRQGFHTLSREEPKRFIVIDGEREAEVISREIWEEVKKMWGIG
ncbi:MAG: dTMP kinase [Calditrichia bacterium]